MKVMGSEDKRKILLWSEGAQCFLQGQREEVVRSYTHICYLKREANVIHPQMASILTKISLSYPQKMTGMEFGKELKKDAGSVKQPLEKNSACDFLGEERNSPECPAEVTAGHREKKIDSGLHLDIC